MLWRPPRPPDAIDWGNLETRSTREPSWESPLKLTESAIQWLRGEKVSTADLQRLLAKLAELLNYRFASPSNLAVFEDAILTAPWLTADAQRVMQQQSDLLRALDSCCRLSHQLGESENSRRELLQRLSEFAELYIETETA